MDGGPGAGQQLPLVPGQAGVQAVHQAHHQGQHQVTSQPDFLHLVPLRPLTVNRTFNKYALESFVILCNISI